MQVFVVFFFFTSRKDTKKTRDTLFSALYTCVYSSSFRLARVVIVPATNCLANVIMPLVLYLMFFPSICKPKECDNSCFFNIRRFRFFLILVWYEKNGLCFTLHAKLDCRELKPYPGGMLQTTKIILSDVGFFSRVHRLLKFLYLQSTAYDP